MENMTIPLQFASLYDHQEDFVWSSCCWILARTSSLVTWVFVCLWGRKCLILHVSNTVSLLFWFSLTFGHCAFEIGGILSVATCRRLYETLSLGSVLVSSSGPSWDAVRPAPVCVCVCVSYNFYTPLYKYRKGGGMLESLYPFVHVSEFVRISNLLNHSTILNQTWHGDVLSRGRVSCTEMGSLSSMARSQWGVI